MKQSGRILIVSSEYPPLLSPESAHTLRFCDELFMKVESICLVTTRRKGVAEFAAGRPYPVIEVGERWNWRTVFRLLTIIHKFKPDGVLLIYLSRIFDFLPAITFAPMLSRLFRRRMRFVTLFENVLKDCLRWGRFGNRGVRLLGPQTIHPVVGRLLRDSTAIIGLSPAHLAQLAEMDSSVATKAKLLPVPPLISVPDDSDGELRRAGRQRLGLQDSNMLIAYFGYIYVGKGIETALRAAALDIADGIPLFIVLIGGIGDERYNSEMRALANALGLEKSVHWTGYCDESEASMFLHAADLAILPFDDGLRLNNSSFSTAAAHGLAVVSTLATPCDPQFRNGENVWLVPPKDPPAMAQAIKHLAEHPQELKRLSENAARLAKNIFSWSSVVGETLELLQWR